jgi:voltage-gated potassium channel Kch
MKPVGVRLDYFWVAQSGLTALLVVTLVYTFFVCALGHFSFGALVGRLLFSLIIITGVMATFRQRWLRFFVIALALASLCLTWLQHIYLKNWSLTLLNAGLGMFFLILLLAILIVQVFRRGAVTPHRIRGAIVVYLLLGGLWSFFYFIVALVMPEAFHWPEGLPADDVRAVQQVLTYFSYITLTTTGYGDVTPAIPLTRTLAVFEALAGQLYLVITLARLVSQAILSPDPQGDKEE